MMDSVKDWILKDLLNPVSHDVIRLNRTKLTVLEDKAHQMKMTQK